MLDFLQLYHGTVLFSKKIEIMSSIDIIYIKERSHSVSNFLRGRFPMSPLLEFLLHTHITPHFPSKCLGNVFASEQYEFRGFSTGAPQPSCQDYPKNTVPGSSSKDNRLEPHHRVQRCSELSQHSRDWTIMMAEPQRCLAAMRSH